MLRHGNEKTDPMLRRMIAGFLALALGALGTGSALSDTAPAGMRITNTAEATYFNAELGVTESVQSNTVTAEVLPVPALEVTGEQVVRTARSTINQYSFIAENTGNVPLQTAFDVTELANDDFDVSGELFVDTNNNGVIDSGDKALAAGETIPLDPGQRMALLFRYQTPASVGQDDRSISELNATGTPASGTPVTAARQSQTIIDDATLTLLKSGALRADDRQIDYTIRARNNAEASIKPSASLEGEALLVDGAPREAVLVRDPIPLNTVFVSAAPGGGFEPVYHLRGAAKHSYVSLAPDDLSSVDAIAFTHDTDFVRGRAADLVFTVALSEVIAEQDIVNIAHSYTDSGGGIVERPSNEVAIPVTGPGQTIDFLGEPGGPPLDSTPFERNVLVGVGAARCNLTDGIDSVEVTVTTTFLKDREVLIGTETGPNTGIFETAPIGVIRADAAVELNNVLEGVPGDNARANATAVCLGETLSTEIGLQPGGFLFDSVTNAPVSGARVVVFPAGGSEISIAETLSDSSGYFNLGTIPRGTYRLEVFPPLEYRYPSVREVFPGFDRTVDEQISYGIVFTFDGGPIANIDIPLDPAKGIPITIDKSADRDTIRRGGIVIYTLTARNEMDQQLLDAVVVDQLPPGLHYVEGSARRDGEAFEEAPTLNRGGVLTFDLDTIAPNGQTEITYALRAGTAAGRGKKTNTAFVRGRQAGTTILFQSETARSTVTVDDRGGVFSDDAVVIGRVFLDRNGDGIQTELDDEDNPHNEPGVPGVKIVTSTGLFVVTDSEGRYSLFGLRPVTHVFALQSATLPRGATVMDVEIDDVLAPGSRLIDLKRGEVRGEDFPLTWSAEAEADVAARIERFEGLDKDESLLRDDLPLSFDATSRNSSRDEAGLDTTTELLTEPEDREIVERPKERPEAEIRADIEEQIKTLDPGLGFVDAANGDETGRPSMSVRIKGPTKGGLRLELNGETIPGSQIGTKVIDSDRGVQVFEYVALRLKPNANTLTAIVTDPFGNDRGREEITVFAPGEPAALQLVAPKEAPANSRARIPVLVRIVDAEGRLVRVPSEVTLDADNGTWDVRDIRETKRGVQAYIDNGEATFDFIPPDLVGGETISVDAGFAEVEAEIGFTPDLSERTFVGVIEGAISFGEKGRNIEGLMTSRDISSFEETTEGVRGQLYLKGKILGENLLTLRYDSDQDNDERLFRDIRRDEFYPVYGDNSERGFDAQSSTSLYVKVEREQSYILYGDIAIEPQASPIRLGAYRRSLPGVRAHIEQGPVTVDLFVAQTDERQRVIEFRGRGISGPYDVALDGIVEGSEVVEIITRDRDQRAVIIETETQTHLTDYTLDFFRGALIFNRPIPQLDDDLNPVSIRVTYETEEGAGEDYFVYGGEIRVEPVEGFAVGYREVHSDADRAFDERRTVRAGYAEGDFGKYGKAELEIAQTENNLGEEGLGARASYELQAGGHTIRAEAARTDEEFDAPNSSVAAGREEVRIRTDHIVTEKIAVETDTLYTRNVETGERRMGAELKGRYRIDPSLDVIAGVRGVETRDDDGTDEVFSGIIGADYRPLWLPGATLHAEFEQDFREQDNWRVTVGGDYQWNPNLRFYALNEISSTETGFFGLGDGANSNFTTRVGAEYQVTAEMSGYSEYRQSSGVANDSGVANGFRGEWQLSEHLAMRFNAEHVEPIDDADSRSSSAGLGASYENDELGLIWRNDVEVDRDERGMGFYTNTAVGYELGKDFTLLARNRLAVDLRDDDRIRDRLRFGLAWRPERDTRIKSLALYEYELDDDSDRTEQAHRWSVALNYAPTDDLRLRGKYAGEHSEFEGAGIAVDSTLHLGLAGIEYDFAEDQFGKDRFAIGGHVALFTDNDGDDVTAGLGLELKANVTKNVQIAVGYNHIDVEEDRLRDIYHSGFYARLRLKLDDSIWDAFDDTGLSTAPTFGE